MARIIEAIVLALVAGAVAASTGSIPRPEKRDEAKRQKLGFDPASTCTGSPESLFFSEKLIKFIVSTFEDLAAQAADVFDVAEPLAKALGAKFPHDEWDIILAETVRVNQTVTSFPFGGAGFLSCVEPKYDNVGLIVFGLQGAKDERLHHHHCQAERRTMDFPGVANLTYIGYNDTAIGDIIRGVKLIAAAFEIDLPGQGDPIMGISTAIEMLMLFYGPYDFAETSFTAFADQPRLKTVSSATQWLVSFYDLDYKLMFMQANH